MAAVVGMDQATEEWEQVFQELIREVKPRHTWTLVTDKNLLPNVLQQGWSQYQQQTFARFQCSSCPRSWASAHVQVLFHMRWSSKKHRGQVKMRVFSQRCQQCAQPQFEVPEFTLENIRRILTNLVFRILRKCYKEEFKMMEEMPTAKDARLEGPHDSVNCEACLQGFCVQRGLGLAPQGSAPPSLSTSLKDAGVSGATTTCSHSPRSPSPKADQLLVLAVTPKHPKLSKADPKVSHASKPSGTLRIPTEEVSPPLTVLTVTPKVPDPPKADPKVSRTLKPSAAPRYLSEEVSPPFTVLTVTPKVPDPPKADPKVSRTSKPSAAPRYLSEEVSPPFTVLTVTPKVPDPPKADPKVSRTSKPSAAPRYLSEVVSPPLTVTPEVPDPPNADAKVHNWLATHVPSPTNSWATAGAAAWDTRVPVPPWRRPDACSPQQSPAPTRRSLCCCCRYLLIVIVTVAVLVLVFKLL